MAVSVKGLVGGATACAVVFVGLLVLAYGSDGVRAIDAAALRGFLGLRGDTVSPVALALVELCDPPAVLVGAGLLTAVALARGRPRLALFVVVLVGLTSVSSQLLKALLAFPRAEGTVDGAVVGAAAYPSGHATAAMSLAIALVVALPARLRLPAAVLGAGFALGVSYSLIATGGHFPSDVVGGFLLATGAGLGLLAALRAAGRRFPARVGREGAAQALGRAVDAATAVGVATALGIALLVTAAVAGVVLVFHLPAVLGYIEAHTTFFAVAAGLALSAAILLGLFTVVVSRRA